jgi:hypothetical protein
VSAARVAREKGAKILVFRVHEEGAPLRYMKGAQAPATDGK